MSARILVVDDDALSRRLCARALKPTGMSAQTVSSAEDALVVLGERPFDLVLTDLRMHGLDGAGLLREVRQRWPELPVVVMTSHGSIELAVELMRNGATDFITKPVEPATLPHRIERALRQSDLEVEVRTLRARLGEAGRASDEIIGDSPAIQRLRERLVPAARADACVLVQGETGTGKELIVRALHDLSARREHRLVNVNCGALPGELLESELFGHMKGAFTDAKRDKTGMVDEANGGTLFLDEIGDLPLALQVKILRFLQEGEIRPVGANRAHTVDVRVVAATHRDLRQAVQDGEFREDLYYRLNVVPLRVPPLRERRGDIGLLARHLLARHARRSSMPGVELTPAAVEALEGYAWPGNVRELENVLHRALVFATDRRVDADDLEFDPATRQVAGAAAEIGAPDLDQPLRDAKAALVEDFERRYVEAAVAEAGGNLAQAARRAGKDRKSLWELCRRYGIDPDAFRR